MTDNVYQIKDYVIYENKKDGTRYSTKGFAYRYPDKAPCILMEDTHFATQWVVTLTDFQELFTKVPDDDEE